MSRPTIHIDPETLAWASRLSPEDRLRQANAAFRLYYALNRPFERPVMAGFDSWEELHEFEREHLAEFEPVEFVFPVGDRKNAGHQQD